jgi:murein DD-endopeptidase MepM/ murein hydrolase activator NlpD
MHEGVDLASPVGEAQRAAESGVVVLVEPNGTTPTSGNRITIDHGYINGQHVTTRYHHLSAFNVAQGQNVAKGQIIGWTGETGKVTGPHVHFEVRIDGKAVNPMSILA